MRVFAYCAQSFVLATGLAAGVEPLTCPPVTAASFDPAQLAGHALLYFDLHGEPGVDQWFGDARLPALTAEQIRSVDLGGAVVFATNCYLADAGSPMLDALLDAGARCVIAGPGRNYAGAQTVFGASLLGQAFRAALEKVADPAWALNLAKWAVRADGIFGSHVHRQAAQDTIGFGLFARQKEGLRT